MAASSSSSSSSRKTRGGLKNKGPHKSSVNNANDVEEQMRLLLSEHSFELIYACDSKARVLASSRPLKKDRLFEMSQFFTLFDDRDEAVEHGVFVDGEHFEVHRHHEHLMYGRRDDGGDDMLGGAGFAAYRYTGDGDDDDDDVSLPIYFVGTFSFPTLTAHAVPLLQLFAKSFRNHSRTSESKTK
jgi:hypothetical protein